LQSTTHAQVGVTGTTRASLYLYSTREEIDRMIDILQKPRLFSMNTELGELEEL